MTDQVRCSCGATVKTFQIEREESRRYARHHILGEVGRDRRSLPWCRNSGATILKEAR
jgi:hypothetical protein